MDVIIVEDTNILIDLFNSGLIHYCQEMDISFHTTRYVVAEIDDSEQQRIILPMIANKILIVDLLDNETFAELNAIIEECKDKNNLSDTDCSVYLLAKKLSCRLLTSDQKLRKYAQSNGIDVNGFLWLTDKMVHDNIVSKSEMITYLSKYLKSNSRAPEQEVNERIKEYKESIIK